jgi:Rrf2 family protein
MLKLTKKADYGLIALKHLAMRSHPEDGMWSDTSNAREIADTYGIPLPLLSKILQKLARAGFLQSEHGTNGGYRLARDPRLISALEVIRSIDGPIILTACFTEHGGRECHHSEKCIVREPLRKVHEGILNMLDRITISDMSSEDMNVPPDVHASARLYGLEPMAAAAGAPKEI